MEDKFILHSQRQILSSIEKAVSLSGYFPQPKFLAETLGGDTRSIEQAYRRLAIKLLSEVTEDKGLDTSLEAIESTCSQVLRCIEACKSEPGLFQPKIFLSKALDSLFNILLRAYSISSSA